MRVKSAVYKRDVTAVKHVGLFGALWHRRDAQLDGYDDSLFIDSGSFVSEGATWDIGFFDGDKVIWPNAETLPGVTMRLLRQVHDQTITAPVHLRDLPEMQAAFATNTAVGVRAISSIDRVDLADDHDILTTLRKEYEEIAPTRSTPARRYGRAAWAPVPSRRAQATVVAGSAQP